MLLYFSHHADKNHASLTIKVHFRSIGIDLNVFKGCYEHLSITTLHYCFPVISCDEIEEKQIQLA